MTEHNTLSGPGPALSIQQLNALEAQLDCPLPEDYRKFLLLNNGGTPAHATFRVTAEAGNDGDDEQEQEGEEWWVDYFYRIDPHLAGPAKDAETGSLAFWRAVLDAYLPPDAIPIACVARDSFWLLYLRGPRRGEVHLIDWDEVDESGGDERSPDDIEAGRRFIASSFGKAFASLYEGD